MNILDYWIKEIHSEVESEDIDGSTIVEVDVTTNCWGSKERNQRKFSKRSWELAKKLGYWQE